MSNDSEVRSNGHKSGNSAEGTEGSLLRLGASPEVRVGASGALVNSSFMNKFTTPLFLVPAHIATDSRKISILCYSLLRLRSNDVWNDEIAVRGGVNIWLGVAL